MRKREVDMKVARVIIAVCAVGLMGSALAQISTARAATEPAARASASADAWGGCTYVVRPGDNLFRIAIRHGVSYWYLAQINGLYNPNYIYAGMLLVVPCGNVPPPYPPPRCAPPQTYVVKPKDNLFRIALNFGTTINAIRNANHLWGRVLRPNMRLVIPCPGSVQYGSQTPGAPIARETPPPPTVVPPPTSAAQPSKADVTVTLQNGQINPAQVNIKAGQTVMWTNADPNTYTLLSGIPGQPNNVFASPPLAKDGTFLFKFDAAGNYSYYVNENPMMVGQVNVSP
jgi:LysM repeat protein